MTKRKIRYPLENTEIGNLLDNNTHHLHKQIDAKEFNSLSRDLGFIEYNVRSMYEQMAEYLIEQSRFSVDIKNRPYLCVDGSYTCPSNSVEFELQIYAVSVDELQQIRNYIQKLENENRAMKTLKAAV